MIKLVPEDLRTGITESGETAPYCCTPAWAGLCRTVFGYEIRAFSIERESARIGWFRYAVVRSPIFGTRLVSMPFSDEGALWFKPGAEQVMKNWYTPPALNEGTWTVISQSDAAEVRMTAHMKFQNASGTDFNIDVMREVRLLGAKDFRQLFGATAATTSCPPLQTLL